MEDSKEASYIRGVFDVISDLSLKINNFESLVNQKLKYIANELLIATIYSESLYKRISNNMKISFSKPFCYNLEF